MRRAMSWSMQKQCILVPNLPGYLLLLFIACLSCYTSECESMPIRATHASMNAQSKILNTVWGHGMYPPKVWQVTRYALLSGPTIAIFLYNRISAKFNQYRPLLSVKAVKAWEGVRETELAFRTNDRISMWRPSRQDLLCTAVANEVIRLMNRKLRERILVAMLRSGNRSVEHKWALSKVRMRHVAERTLADVLTNGAGKLLDEGGQNRVRKLVLAAVK